MQKTKVAIVRCTSYCENEVKEAVKKACGLIGAISGLIRRGDRVLIKPCLLKACMPAEGINTHPEVVRAVIRLVKESGGIVTVGDSPIGSEVIDNVYEVSGIKQVCLEEQVKLVKFKEAKIIDGIPVAKEALNTDIIVSVPKFKTHGLTILTGAIKSMFGIVPGLFKVKCHALYPKIEDFCRTLVKIYSFAKPNLIIVDGIVAMEGNGPVTGALIKPGRIIAGLDGVSVDAVLAKIMGVNSLRVLTTKFAYEAGIGNGSLNDIDIINDDIPDNKIYGFKLPSTVPFFNISIVALKTIGTTFLSFNRPMVREDKCIHCEKCISICPAQVIYSMNKHIKFDYNRCKLCFCCCEACPSNAIYINKGILEYVSKLKLIFRRWFRYAIRSKSHV